MKKITKTLLLFFFITISFLWIYPPNWLIDRESTLTYIPWWRLHPSLRKPLPYCLLKTNNSFAIRVMLPLKDCKIQDEIRTYYKKHLPKELKKALKSSTNLHNPALKPLIENFDKALKSTSLYKKLDRTLKLFGFTLEKDISFEKFILFKKENPYIFHADIWLHAKAK